MRRIRSLTVGTSVLLLVGCAQKASVSYPNLSAQGWLNLPSGKSSLAEEDLEGKALFVEFWATW